MGESHLRCGTCRSGRGMERQQTAARVHPYDSRYRLRILRGTACPLPPANGTWRNPHSRVFLLMDILIFGATTPCRATACRRLHCDSWHNLEWETALYVDPVCGNPRTVYAPRVL